MKNPRVLFFDIETTPNLCFTWRLGKQYVGYENLHKEREVSVICWKWAGEIPVRSLSFNMDKFDLSLKDDKADYELLRIFKEVYQEADLAVGHNAIKFDIATIRARLIKHELADISPLILDDTYLASKGIRFNSHKLDYLSQYLGVGSKAPHDYSLWKRVMLGDRKALRETISYCKQDVVLLERVYGKLKPFIKTKLHAGILAEDGRVCPGCGADALKIGRHRINGRGTYIQYQCRMCGKWCHGRIKYRTDVLV